jgi:ankyrin repeat protein
MTRSIPPNPSLEFDRKQAKSLLDAACAGDADAVARVRANHPRFAGRLDPSTLALHDAQLVIAREYGFASWPRWKQFVQTRQLDRAGRAEELIRAACDGDMRKATMLLGAEPQLARFDLYTACVCGEADAVAQHLQRDPQIAGRKGGPLDRGPILYACFSRFLRSDPQRAVGIEQVVRLLLENGADPDSFYIERMGDKDWQQQAIYGAAGIANNPNLTRMLLAAGASPTDGGNEALYHACEFTDTTCMRLLLEARPDPKRISYCLGRALDFDNPPMVELLLAHGADPNLRIEWPRNRTHLHKAVMEDRPLRTVRALLDAGGNPNATDSIGLTPLRYAVRNGSAELSALLIERGADPLQVTEEDRAMGALMCPGKSQHGPVKPHPDLLCRAAMRNDVPAIHRLLDAGAEIDAPGGTDSTPALHWAAWRGQTDATRALLERGASLTLVNCYAAAALGTAIHGSTHCHDPEGGMTMKLADEVAHGDYPSVVETLIHAGAELPDRIVDGSDAVQEVLRRFGVPDADG